MPTKRAFSRVSTVLTKSKASLADIKAAIDDVASLATIPNADDALKPVLHH